ncbi:MAG: hypothetical protein F4196_06935 [Acidimicrobiia bacterium]|nr:hypothetical protein [Acidimicrobiia bacterium]
MEFDVFKSTVECALFHELVFDLAHPAEPPEQFRRVERAVNEQIQFFGLTVLQIDRQRRPAQEQRGGRGRGAHDVPHPLDLGSEDVVSDGHSKR